MQEAFFLLKDLYQATANVKKFHFNYYLNLVTNYLL